MGLPSWSFAADAHHCIMVQAHLGLPNTRMRRDVPRSWQAPPGSADTELPANAEPTPRGTEAWNVTLDNQRPIQMG
jgi:hypothetical protein